MNHPTKYILEFHCEQILIYLNLQNTINYYLDVLSHPKSIIYKCVQKAVNFNIDEFKPLIQGKTSIPDIFYLYEQAYKNTDLNIENL